MGKISKLSKGNLVNDLPKLNYVRDHIYEACQFGKQIRSSFKHVSTSRPLQLIHMDLFGPMRTESIGGKSYGYVLVDDYSRYTWVYFLANKSDCFDSFKTFCLQVHNEKGYPITSIRSDHGREFENAKFQEFCEEHGITHNFSAPRTPQQKGVAERKNRFLLEMARTMLSANSL